MENYTDFHSFMNNYYIFIIIFTILAIIFLKPSWMIRDRLGWLYWFAKDDMLENLDDRSLFEKIVDSIRNKNNRKRALKNAGKFLRPYKELFGHHCLNNEFCQVNLVRKSKQLQIQCFTKQSKNIDAKKALIAISDDELETDLDEIWNLICWDFSEYSSYIDIFEKCKIERLIIKESVFGEPNSKIYREAPPTLENLKIEKPEQVNTSLVDVNTATENELKALPGINVMVAKRIIIERNKTPFLSKADFFEKLNISENISEILIPLICVIKGEKIEETKVGSSIIIEEKRNPSNNERIVDL